MNCLLPVLGTAFLLSVTSSTDVSDVCSAVSSPSCRCTDRPSPATFANVRCTFNATQPPSSLFTNSSLAGSVTLHTLDLSNNGLDHLPGQFFSGEVIDTLVLQGNRFEDVPAALVKLGALKALDLSFNALRLLSWEVLAADVPGLQRLDVSGNELTALSADPKGLGGNVTTRMHSLRELSAARNVIASIDDGALDLLRDLVSLDLAHNRLTRVTQSTFRTQDQDPTLQTLNLTNNSLTYLDPLAFHPLQRLHVLGLAHNDLGHVLGKLMIPPHLSSLDLRACGLTSVSRCRFSAMSDLAALDLRGNPLNCTCDLYLLHQRLQRGDSKNQSQWSCRQTVPLTARVDGSSVPSTTRSSGEETAVADLQDQCEDSYAVCPSVSELVSQMTTTLDVETSGNSLKVSWALEVSDDLSIFLTGFHVRYIPEGDADPVTSDVVPPEQRSLTMKTAGISEHFVVCLDVLVPASTVDYQQCKNVQKGEDSGILVGILAGVVFLAPCMVIMTVIVFKDKRIAKAMYMEVDTAEVDVEGQGVPGKVAVSINGEQCDTRLSTAGLPSFSKGDGAVVVVQSTVVSTQDSKAISGKSSSTNGKAADCDGFMLTAGQSDTQDPADTGGMRNEGFLCQAGHVGDQVCADPEHESTNM